MNNSRANTNRIEQRKVDHSRHAGVIERLRAEGPKVGRLFGVHIARPGAHLRSIACAEHESIGGEQIELAGALLEHVVGGEAIGAREQDLLDARCVDYAGLFDGAALKCSHRVHKKRHTGGHDGRGDRCAREEATAGLAAPQSAHAARVRHQVGLEATVADGQLPGGHAARRELGHSVLRVRVGVGVGADAGEASDADHVRHVGRIVERAVDGSVVADAGDHDDAGGAHLAHLVHKRRVQEVRPADRQVEDVDARAHRVVERVQEPGGVGALTPVEHLEDVEACARRDTQTARLAHVADQTGHERAVADAIARVALVRPVDALDDLTGGEGRHRRRRVQARVKHCHAHVLARDARLPQNPCAQLVN